MIGYHNMERVERNILEVLEYNGMIYIHIKENWAGQ